MKTEIKNRIDQLNNGEIPNGYKKAEFGVFPCDWETDKAFGDLFDFYGGLSKSRDELGEKGYAYLHYGDLHRGSFNCVSLEQYSQLPKCDITLNGKEACLMEDGDVAFLDASEDLEGTSRAVLIDNTENEPFIAGLHIIYGKSKDDSLEKWYKQYITSSENVKKQFQRLSVGFKVYGVNRESLPKIRIAYPASLQEQSRIAEILMKWDEAIELYQQQIEKLNKLKRSALANLFPQKGQSTPKYRFAGFTDPWEQRNVGDTTEEFQSGKFIAAADINETGEYPVYGGNGLRGYCNTYNHDGDYALIGRQGALCGNMNYSHGKAYFTEHAVAVKANASSNTKFLYYMLDKMNLGQYSDQSAQPGLAVGKLVKLESMFPSKPEQDRIAEFLTDIDNTITLHQRKVDTAKKQRAVLQQYLLNGIVRVNI